ncbi:unnamed protein product [Caenorhabditis nigoni]
MQEAEIPRFPAFKLPLNLRYHLIRHLDPIELLELSLVSKESWRCVQTAIPKNQIQVRANFCYRPTVSIYLGNQKNLRDEHSSVMGIGYMKARNGYLKKEKKNELYECAENIRKMTITWIQVWSDYLCQTFKCTMYSVSIHPDHCIGRVPLILNWLNTRQPSIENLFFAGERVVDDDLSVAINNCKVNNYLSVSTSTIFDIEPLNPTIKTDYIRLVGVPSISWMSVDNLITFDCFHIDLSGFMFDEMGLNRYLKAWINGCNPRMEYLKASGHFIDLEEALHDIELENGPPPKRFYNHYMLDEPFDAAGGIRIRRNNEDLATIKQEFVIRPKSQPRIQYFFTFVVWNSN